MKNNISIHVEIAQPHSGMPIIGKMNESILRYKLVDAVLCVIETISIVRDDLLSMVTSSIISELVHIFTPWTISAVPLLIDQKIRNICACILDRLISSRSIQSTITRCAYGSPSSIWFIEIKSDIAVSIRFICEYTQMNTPVLYTLSDRYPSRSHTIWDDHIPPYMPRR